MSPYTLALVLIRVAGAIALFLGLLELVILPFAFILSAGPLKSFEAFVDPWVMHFATSGLFYALAGSLCLAISRRLARLAAKHCEIRKTEEDADPATRANAAQRPS